MELKYCPYVWYCAHCGNMIFGKGFTVEDPTGERHVFCDKNCADNFEE